MSPGTCGGLKGTQPKGLDPVYPAMLEKHVLVRLPDLLS
jgi:hypothetical protein